jgi:hypothetical protein
MAAPNATVSTLGQINGAGSATALFLKVFGGEVLTAFWAENKFLSRTMVRTITSGNSAQFPASHKGTASYHTPGNMIVGSGEPARNERVITIDDLLVASRFVANIEEAKNHYDVRSELSRDVGFALSSTMDKNIAQVALLAARASATVTGGDGGTAITSASSGTNADALVAALFDAAQALDEKNVPENDRYVYLKPDQYYNLVNSSSKLIHTDYGNTGNGSVAQGVVRWVAGMQIVKTNNAPIGVNVSTGPAAYQVNGTNTTAIVAQKGAVGTVKLMDVRMEMEYSMLHQGTFIVGSYAVGHGILRPECAVEIKSA